MLLMLAVTGGALAADPLDLNRATLEEILALPIPEEVARGVWLHREYVDYYRSVTDLLDVPGMTAVLLADIRGSVAVQAVAQSPERERKDRLFYRFEWWEGAEGMDESLVELYKDLALDPIDVNVAGVLDLQNLQSVSPVDAVSIFKYRKKVGSIGSRGQLRRVTGLSGWGYSNARNFLSYGSEGDAPAAARLQGNYSLRVESTNYFSDVEDLLRGDRDPGQGTTDTWWDRTGMDNPSPAVLQKLRLRYGHGAQVGLAASRRLGERDLLENPKAFVGLEDLTDSSGLLKIDKIYFGNYQVSWGQGVVMENTDFRSPRKSGYGWGKRYDGVLGDLSRTQQFSFNGAAGEASVGKFRAIGFFSDDHRDAILNADGSVNMLITMSPRLENSQLEEAGLRPMKDVLRERTHGGNLRYTFSPGCHVGVGGYESRYDRFFDPKWDPENPTDKHPLILDDNEDNILPQDGEVFSSYKSDGKYRRVVGADFQWVYRNLALQGEYAELDKGGSALRVGDDPSALVLNGFLQYENLNCLVVYRDYDVAYDNPYQRSFSNYQRFKGSIMEDNFRLADPIYGFVYENAAQPQAEKGFFLSTRYRWHERIITTVEWDTWRRQADMSRYSRWVGKLEYRFLFPLRFKLRHKYQNRERQNYYDPSIFSNVETRMELEYRLSRYDQLEFLYATSYTHWPPRGRLQGEAEATGSSPISGNNAQPAYAFGGWWTHNFESGRMKLDGAAFLYDGFLWFFEKSTFRVADGQAFRAWVEVTDRLSDDLTLRFRIVRENRLRNTAVDMRQYNEEVGGEVDAGNVKNTNNYFRIQVDYAF